MATVSYIPRYLGALLGADGYEAASMAVIHAALTCVDGVTHRGEWCVEDVAAWSLAGQSTVKRCRQRLERDGHIRQVTPPARGKPPVYFWPILKTRNEGKSIMDFDRAWRAHYGDRKTGDSKKLALKVWEKDPPNDGFWSFLKSKNGAGSFVSWLRAYRMGGRGDLPITPMGGRGDLPITPMGGRGDLPLIQIRNTDPTNTREAVSDQQLSDSAPNPSSPQTAGSPIPTTTGQPQVNPNPSTTTSSGPYALTSTDPTWPDYSPDPTWLATRWPSNGRTSSKTKTAQAYATLPAVDWREFERVTRHRLASVEASVRTDPGASRFYPSLVKWLTSWRDYQVGPSLALSPRNDNQDAADYSPPKRYFEI